MKQQQNHLFFTTSIKQAKQYNIFKSVTSLCLACFPPLFCLFVVVVDVVVVVCLFSFLFLFVCL